MVNPYQQLHTARAGREGVVPYDTTIGCEGMMGSGGEPALARIRATRCGHYSDNRKVRRASKLASELGRRSREGES